jgi:hypothetical protein
MAPVYEALDLTASGATVVVNAKALHHFLREAIPPIDRQYTIRFLTQPSERWRDRRGKYRMILSPSGLAAQSDLFRRTCIDLKRLADSVDPALFEHQGRAHGVPAPNALDNAIVCNVRMTATSVSEDVTPP